MWVDAVHHPVVSHLSQKSLNFDVFLESVTLLSVDFVLSCPSFSLKLKFQALKPSNFCRRANSDPRAETGDAVRVHHPRAQRGGRWEPAGTQLHDTLRQQASAHPHHL